jgi:pimeloyl-ACP methyl ester carboxylesterase
VKRKLLYALLAVVTLVPLGLVTVSAATLLSLLHVERKVIADAPNVQLIDLESRDHVAMKAAWTPAPQFTGRCVLSLHGVGGWRGRSQRFLPWLLPAGYSVLAPDLRAHGDSGGDIVTFGLLERFDALDWVAWMRGQGCTAVYGMGESMGASILLMAQEQAPVFTAIVAECPFADLLQAAEERAQTLFPASIAAPLASMTVAGGSAYVQVKEGLDFSKSSPVRSIATLKIPVLLIHGLADSRTPPAHSEQLRAANPAYTQLWLVPGAKHVASYTAAPVEYRQRVLEFLRTSGETSALSSSSR